jgi:serine/threonine protein kinase
VKEADILTKLQHQNIVQLKGMCLDPCHFAIILEFMANGNLKELLLEHKSAHPFLVLLQNRIRMGLDIAQGMKYLHGMQNPIVHRDLKTANVLVDRSYCCKISNFGLSKTRSSSSQTLEGLYAGRLAFVAPERLKDNHDHKSQQADKEDVYAFSIILWQLKELKEPYEDETNAAIIGANVIGGLRPHLSSIDNLANIICNCWDMVPSRRPSFHGIQTHTHTRVHTRFPLSDCLLCSVSLLLKYIIVLHLEIVPFMERILSSLTLPPEAENSPGNDSISIQSQQLRTHEASGMVEVYSNTYVKTLLK